MAVPMETYQALIVMLADVAEKYLMDGVEEDWVKRLGRRVEVEVETLEQRRGEKLRRGRRELMLTKIWAGQSSQLSGIRPIKQGNSAALLPRHQP